MKMILNAYLAIVMSHVAWVACSGKRLVLHSDQDIAAQMSAMQARISKVETENQQLQTRLRQVETDNQQLRSNQGGSVYIRWGKTSCTGNGTSLVHKGFAAGNHYSDYGGGVNTLCLPDDPTWNQYNDVPETWTGELYALEIDGGDTQKLLGYNYHNQDVPCAMCHTQRPVSVMIPGRVNCYPGWSLEYTGYLMSGQHSHKSNTDYICLDANPEAEPHGGSNDDDHIMYFTEATCTSLSCPPYVNGRELACVVCSK